MRMCAHTNAAKYTRRQTTLLGMLVCLVMQQAEVHFSRLLMQCKVTLELCYIYYVNPQEHHPCVKSLFKFVIVELYDLLCKMFVHELQLKRTDFT